MDTATIIALLILIVMLLCSPLKERIRVVGYWFRWVLIGIVLYYAAPPLLSIGVWSAKYTLDKLGWRIVYGIAAVCAFLLMVLNAWRLDRRENRAIKAGSQVAFDKRVQTLMRESKYSYERAVEAAQRVRDSS